jgi:protein farnesyltransferase/geranylgeranyltransferase type-1 subunit alpha
LDVAKHEADYAIHTGATLDPYNESPWRYLIGVLKEQWKIQPDPELMRDYEEKASRLRKVLSDAHKDPDTCVNLTSARIDLYEMKGDKESLKAVSGLCIYLVGS